MQPGWRPAPRVGFVHTPPLRPRRPGVGWVHRLPLWPRASCPISRDTARRLCPGTERGLGNGRRAGCWLCEGLSEHHSERERGQSRAKEHRTSSLCLRVEHSKDKPDVSAGCPASAVASRQIDCDFEVKSITAQENEEPSSSIVRATWQGLGAHTRLAACVWDRTQRSRKFGWVVLLWSIDLSLKGLDKDPKVIQVKETPALGVCAY